VVSVAASAALAPAWAAATVPADAIERAWAALATVPDPEIPMVSVVELGIVRGTEDLTLSVVV